MREHSHCKSNSSRKCDHRAGWNMEGLSGHEKGFGLYSNCSREELEANQGSDRF